MPACSLRERITFRRASLIETAKENELDPYQYLLHVLQTAPQMDLKQDVQKLLPWNISLKK